MRSTTSISPLQDALKIPSMNLNVKVFRDRIFIRGKTKRIGLNIKEILYVEASRNYCTVVTPDKRHILSVPLKKFSSVLNNKTFMRIHRSYLVNLDAIGALDDSYVFINGEAFPISKAYKKDLFSRFTIL